MSDEPAASDRSPLQQVERQVLARVKHLAPEDSSVDVALLRRLVEDEVDHWRQEHRRGRRTADLPMGDMLIERAMRNLTGYGPLEPLLADDDVWEIMVNAPTEIFVKRHRGHDGYHDEVFHDDHHVVRVLTKILDDAGASHRKLDPTDGLQDAQLDSGARLHIVHGDVSRGGHTMVNIRKFTGVAFRQLDELVERDMLSDAAARFLRACVQGGLSIVFAGAPGSGKTTLLSCCAAELDPTLRVVVAEEVFECDVPLANVASMQTRPPRPDRPAVDLRRLVSGFLRMAPDVAIVGEVRDREALPLLLTLSSGVTGYTTIHAGSARQALSRLRFVCQLADAGSDIPMAALNTLVSDAVDIVVHCARTAYGPRVTEIVAVEDLLGGPEATAFTTTTVFERSADDRPLAPTGLQPIRARRHLEPEPADAAAVEVF